MVCVAAALLWRCDGDGTLLDRYPIEPIVNPEVGRLIGDNRIIHVDFDGRRRMRGVTQQGIFATADRFRSLDFEPHPWQAEAGAVGFADGLAVQVQAGSLSISLRYSTDYGKTWAAFGDPIADPSDLAEGSLSVVQLAVTPEQVVWLLCQQGTGRDGRALLYRVDLVRGRSTLVMERAQVAALACGFADVDHGWILYRPHGEHAGLAHVLRTSDGGLEWAEGDVLDLVGPPAITAVTADTLLVYGRQGTAFRSADSGTTFEPVAIGGTGVVTCRAASADVVYALLENGLAKSTDGGHSWAGLQAHVHGLSVSGTALDFHNERAGIVYGGDRLFVTDDGGGSWEALVYPYGYVLD